MGRGHFPHAMAGYGIGSDSPRAPERGQRDLDRADGRLRDSRFRHAGAALPGLQFIDQRPPGPERIEREAALDDRGPVHRLRFKKLPPHPPPLRPLPTEDEDQARLAKALGGAGLAARRERIERYRQRLG